MHFRDPLMIPLRPRSRSATSRTCAITLLPFSAFTLFIASSRLLISHRIVVLAIGVRLCRSCSQQARASLHAPKLQSLFLRASQIFVNIEMYDRSRTRESCNTILINNITIARSITTMSNCRRKRRRNSPASLTACRSLASTLSIPSSVAASSVSEKRLRALHLFFIRIIQENV